MNCVKIRLQRHSNEVRLVQKKLFEAGAKWKSGQEVADIRCTFFYVDENQTITFGSNNEKFQECPYTEITTRDLGIPQESIKRKYEMISSINER
jgi:hypothetical protein